MVIPFTFFALNVILLEQGYSAAWYFISLFFPSPCNVDYSILFVLLGVAWYFINSKMINCAVFAVLSLACWVIPGSCFFYYAAWMVQACIFQCFFFICQYAMVYVFSNSIYAFIQWRKGQKFEIFILCLLSNSCVCTVFYSIF